MTGQHAFFSGETYLDRARAEMGPLRVLRLVGSPEARPPLFIVERPCSVLRFLRLVDPLEFLLLNPHPLEAQRGRDAGATRSGTCLQCYVPGGIAGAKTVSGSEASSLGADLGFVGIDRNPAFEKRAHFCTCGNRPVFQRLGNPDLGSQFFSLWKTGPFSVPGF